MRPPRFGFKYDPFEIPLFYGPHVKLQDQWTLILCHEDSNHALLGATIFNGDSQRAAYYHEKPTEWNLSEFNFLEGEIQIPPSVLILARNYMSNVLGTGFQVHNTSAIKKDNDEAYS